MDDLELKLLWWIAKGFFWECWPVLAGLIAFALLSVYLDRKVPQ